MRWNINFMLHCLVQLSLASLYLQKLHFSEAVVSLQRSIIIFERTSKMRLFNYRKLFTFSVAKSLTTLWKKFNFKEKKNRVYRSKSEMAVGFYLEEKKRLEIY
jgi:hypothetical protein